MGSKQGSSRGKLRRKYGFNRSNRRDVVVAFRRLLLILSALGVVKALRWYLVSNEVARGKLSSLLDGLDLEHGVQSVAVIIMLTGLVGLFVTYIALGVSMLKSKWFRLFFFTLIVNMGIAYLLPDIPVAIIKAILLL